MRKYDNFCSALNTMTEYNSIDLSAYPEKVQELMLTGILNHYEKTFELSWKLSKQTLEYEGVVAAATGSPLEIIKLSYAYGIIDNADIWKAALKDRNSLSHCYDQDVLFAMGTKIKEEYTPMFFKFKDKIEERIRGLYNDGLLPESEIDKNILSVIDEPLDLTNDLGRSR